MLILGTTTQRSIIKMAIPVIRVGKNGVSEDLLKEIEKNIKKHRTVKVKMLSSHMEGKDKKIEAEKIAAKTRAKILSRVGMVVTLHR